MIFDDLTLLTCSFETPKITYSMLQSFVYHHGDGPHNIVIVENSRNNKTVDILNENVISFFRNFGGTHSPSIDIGFDKIKTRYVLLVDTDILFLKPIDDLFQLFKKNDLTIMGELQESRGGYNLYPRISPHACFIDLQKVKECGISFHDQERINKSGSNGFFGNIPLQQNGGGKYYDVGSSFLEDIQKNNLKMAKINLKLPSFVKHYEGMSWRTKSGIKGYEDWGKQVEINYLDDAAIYNGVDIKNKFIGVN